MCQTTVAATPAGRFGERVRPIFDGIQCNPAGDPQGCSGMVRGSFCKCRRVATIIWKPVFSANQRCRTLNAGGCQWMQSRRNTQPSSVHATVRPRCWCGRNSGTLSHRPTRTGPSTSTAPSTARTENWISRWGPAVYLFRRSGKSSWVTRRTSRRSGRPRRPAGGSWTGGCEAPGLAPDEQFANRRSEHGKEERARGSGRQEMGREAGGQKQAGLDAPDAEDGGGCGPKDRPAERERARHPPAERPDPGQRLLRERSEPPLRTPSTSPRFVRRSLVADEPQLRYRFSEPLPRWHDSRCQVVRSDQHRTETQLRPQQPLKFVEVLW